MPTIPLYNPTAVLDACHDVRAPGGYEWWYFDAEDTEHDRQIVAIFLDGFIFHPGYLRAHGKWLRRPTVHPPPLPREHACAYFVVYESGRIAHQFMTQYRPQDFAAQSDRPEVIIGPNRFIAEQDALNLELCGTPWILTARGPKLLAEQKLEGSFSFKPKLSSPPNERIFLSQKLSGAEHHWIVANPLCDVRGSIRCGGKSIEFSGRGYHDHNFGTAPIGPGLKRWLWGRELFEDSACTFHFAQSQDSSLPPEIHFVQADGAGMREIPIVRVEGEWSGITGWRLRYPQSIRFDDAMQLSEPRVIDSSPFYLRLIYESRVGGRSGKAMCEIAYPHRPRWPVLGRMIEMSIDRRAAEECQPP